MKLDQFSDLDVRILAGTLRKQVQKWDETWGNAKWRRENRVSTEEGFWIDQRDARNRAEVLADMFRKEEKRREAKHGKAVPS